MNRIGELEVVVAHWHVRSWGGAEYLVTKLSEVLDIETIYTVGLPSADTPNPFGEVKFTDVRQTLGFPNARRLQHRVGRAAEYSLWEDVDWRNHGDPDVIITSGATTRAVITQDDVLHVNYCHSPPRWLYDLYHDRTKSLKGILARPILRYLRMKDATIDNRVDHYFVNSPVINRRLWKYYKRNGEVLYPPVELDKYHNAGNEGFYLHLGRLDKEKGISAVVNAFEGLDRTLVMAGPEGNIENAVLERINQMDNVEYRGFIDTKEKLELLSKCRALVFNGRNEDFGIVLIEANASGKPILVPDEGFPGYFVNDGTNGYKHHGTATSIRAAIERLESQTLTADPTAYVEEFDIDHFRSKLIDGILKAVSKVEL